MEDKQKDIDNCYKVLKLDNRASKKEVELAFDVLTSVKDLSVQEYRHYRNAFEFLMYEVYNEGKSQEDTENIDVTTESDIVNTIINCIPEKVKDSLEYWEIYNDEELSDKVKALFATQKINLPMFFHSILFNSNKIFGKYFWTSKNIENIIKDTCLNPLVYNDIIFEITYNYPVSFEREWDLKSFIKNLKKIYSKDKHLCKKFEYHNTQFGIMGHCITEYSISESIIQMLKTKAKQINCYLNVSISGETY